MSSVYWIIPAPPRSLWFLIAIIAILAGVLVMMLVIVNGTRRSNFELTDSSLRLHGDLWGRTLPYDSLDVSRARLVDLRGEPELQPTSRRMGTGLPGFSAGWFRLRNGNKALVYLTDGSRAVYIPTRNGYDVLLSPQQPDAMLVELRRRAGALEG
jgi:hypothetical protein